MKDTERTQELADMLSGIVSIATDAIISIDGSHNIVMLNDGAAAIFGYSRDELLGRPLGILIPDQFRATHETHIHTFGSGRETARRMGERSEILGRRKTGETFQAEASISRFEMGGRRIYTAVLRDVTELKAAERRLLDSNKLLEIALEIGQVGICEHDHDSGRLFWSSHFRHVLGVGEHMPASLEVYLDLVHSDDRDVVSRALCLPAGASDSSQYVSEHRLIRPDGAVRWLALRTTTTFAGSRPVKTIGAMLDITERKEAQSRLEERVDTATRELRLQMKRREESQAQLLRTQRLEAFGQLTGGVAHDFNNLLTVITGNLELLELRLEDEKQRVLLKRAQDAAEMGARLTGRLLTFAQKRQFSAQALNLNDLVIGMAELLERTLGEPIALTTSLERLPWTILADPSEIENAILNLAINARDAMPTGGKLIIETANVSLDGETRQGSAGAEAGDYVRLSVSDTGTGMAPDILRRALEPFFTTKETGRGTGLGLSTIYGFVTQAGGTVNIYSEVGRGTTVNIYLPRSITAQTPASASPPLAPPAATNGERILLVEDNPDVREVTRAQLEALGYRVVEAENGPAAVAILTKGNTFALVFSDVVMAGGMSGFDVVRWVRANAAGTKVLLASGYPNEVLRVDANQRETVEILRKPFSRSALADALDAHAAFPLSRIMVPPSCRDTSRSQPRGINPMTFRAIRRATSVAERTSDYTISQLLTSPSHQ